MKRTKKRNKELGITKVRTGFTHTQETKEKISRKNSGKKRSPEAIEKTRQANLGRPQTDYQKKKAEDANSKKWLIIKPDGTEEVIVNLSKYSDENGLNGKTMNGVANGRQKQHKGYKVFRLD
jgi:hypothetical protein